MKYPDRQLIQQLHMQYSGYGIKTMKQEEILDLINHTTELSRDQEKYIAVLRARVVELEGALVRISEMGEAGSMAYTLAGIARAVLEAK